PMEPEPQVGVTDDEAPPPGGRQGRFDGGDEIEGVEFGARNRPVDPSLDPAQAETGKTVSLTSVSDDGAWGRVGLRSLVLDLPAVGRAATFERPGGKGQLVVQVVRDDTLTLAAGVLALLGLVAGVLV